LLLARNLRDKGHIISYLGIADCKPTIYANGFKFFSVYERWFPKGWFDNVFLKATSQDFNLESAKELANHFHNFINYLVAGGGGELEMTVREINPDIVLISTSGVDSIIWALMFHKMKIKSIYSFSVLGGRVNCITPPVQCDLSPNQSPWSPIKIIFSWLIYRYKRIQHETYLTRNGLNILPPSQIKKIAKYCNYSYTDICFWTDMPNPQLKLPELVLCPPSFEYPISKKEGRYYVEASVDLHREQSHFPWNRVAESRPIVYVALGTLPLLAKNDCEKFFRTVIEVSNNWPTWNWILSIGNNSDTKYFNNVASNVIIVNHAPQLEILKKASLMITHGGPNSIKECIFFGVPMIVFPLWFDQPGNVARITYHGLGLKGDFKTINVNNLQELITEVTTNTKYIEQVRLMQKSFIKTEEERPSLKLIEEFIDQ
jgi:UDP:flavonoid glycosyltransferase YjiC (YdhE family)